MVTVVVLTAAVVIPRLGDRPLRHGIPDLMLQTVAIFVLAFLPGWMFLRFLQGRAGALWDEYVIHLHRLQWDRPRNLPRPPQASTFYDRWLADGGPAVTGFRSIYQEKFDAYYGRSISKSVQEPGRRVRPETLFPVYLTTFVLAVCWTALLWDHHARFALNEPASESLRPMLAFAFLGAYLFVIQMLIRRFYQNDLKSSAYLSAVLRIATALILAAAVYPILSFHGQGAPVRVAVAFLIGFFPVIGIEFFRQFTAKTLRLAVPSLKVKYPLSDLDGLNIWYEARLLEEGIEDMQSLVTANFVDVLLHTRVPAGRLIDWVNQSYLLLHLNTLGDENTLRRRADTSGGTEGTTADVRTVLRSLGIRTATDLLCAFTEEGVARHDETDGTPSTPGGFDFLAANDLEPARIRALVRILADDPGLHPILNWQNNGVPLHIPAAMAPRPKNVLRLPPHT
ncbi:hypothetical protein [Actinoallomurus acanthiterrae]